MRCWRGGQTPTSVMPVRWGRRNNPRADATEAEQGSGPFAFSCSVNIRCSPDRLWNFIWDPRSQLRLDDEVISAVTMPGPVRAVGEVQAYLRRSSMGLEGSFLEVVEYGPGRRAVYRAVEEPSEEIGTLAIETLVEETGDGCRLTHVQHAAPGEGYIYQSDLVRQLHVEHVSKFTAVNERIRAILEAE